MKRTYFLIFIILLIVAFGVGLMFSKPEAQKPLVANFEECVAAGNPVMESYPEQCRTPDGQSFTKQLAVLEAKFGNPVTLHINEQEKFSDGLVVTLIEINDSRCKPEVVCVWAGELSSRFMLLGGNISQFKEIRLGTMSAKSIAYNGYIITLNEATENTSTITVTKEGGQVVCTQDAKLCPDGSYVSRTGPNCEFAKCPEVAPNSKPNSVPYNADGSCPSGYVNYGIPLQCVTPEYNQYCQSNPCPICLAKNTLIDTPLGPVAVQDIKIGAPVWTVNTSGKRVVGVVEKVSKTAVPPDHIMVHLVLQDGRTFLASPGHPTIDGLTVGNLAVGDNYNGIRVVSVERVAYHEGYTYDILVSGETGFYFANGILLDSTLR